MSRLLLFFSAVFFFCWSCFLLLTSVVFAMHAGKDHSIEELFNNMLDKLMKKYGDKILTMNINQIADGSNRHYG